MQQKLTSPPARRLAIVAAIVAGACWGVSFLAPRVLAESSPHVIAFYRFLFFGLTSAFALLIRRNKRPPITWGVMKAGLGLSLAGYSLYYALLAVGVKGTGVTFATAIIALLPLTILLASTSAPEWRRLALPVVLIVSGGILIPFELFGAAYTALLSRSPLERLIGLGATFLALVLWTVFAVLNSRFLKRHPEWRPLEWAGVLGVASAVTAFVLFLVASRENATAEFLAAGSDPRFLLWTGFMGVAGAWFAGALWNYASRVLPAAAVGMLLVFESVFGLAFGFLYDRRLPTLREGLAAGCLISGAMLGIGLMKRRAVDRVVGRMDRVDDLA